MSAVVGILFGMSQPAHQGLYLAVATLGRAILLRLGVYPREVVHQLQLVRFGQCAGR